MNPAISSRSPCTESDIKILHDELRSQYRGFAVGGVLILIIALVMPWLGSSRTHGKAMVDYMSYPQAIISILLVFGFVIAVSWILKIPKIKKDIGENIKITHRTQIKKKETYKYKKAMGWSIIPVEMPFPSGNKIYVTKNEFDELSEGDEIEISYFPNSKKVIKVVRM